MEARNQSSVTEIILLGLTDDPNLQILLFLLFLMMYIITVVGNLGIFALIISQSSLHTPMYFFISNLSFSDFCYSSVIVPKMLKNLSSGNKSISFIGCVAQAYLFIVFGGMEIYLLAAMAYDRYAAICQPLLYHLIINRSKCIQLVTVVYLSSIVPATIDTWCAFHASFCDYNVIDHFYCDLPPLMKLSCSDRFISEIVFFAVAFLFSLSSLLITITSYIFIISTILQIPATSGRFKTFSTCGSHLTAISLFYGTSLFLYLQVPGSGSVTQNKVLSVVYTIVIPMLNPMIYSLRNQEVKGAMQKMLHGLTCNLFKDIKNHV